VVIIPSLLKDVHTMIQELSMEEYKPVFA
jgi:hypothetical protein